MRQVPTWAWIVLNVSAFLAVTQVFTMNTVSSVEERVQYERKLEPILNPGVLVLTTETPTVTVSEDTETCQRIRDANPQTPEGVVEKYPEVPVGLVQLVTYYECDAPGRQAYGAFFIWSTDKEYKLQVPPGGEIVDYDEVPQKPHCNGEVKARILLVRGISVSCGPK